MMEYKGYMGKAEYDDEAEILHGEVINTRDVITFQAKSVNELNQAFHESIDDYLAFCSERGEEPDKPFSGQFVTRIPSELHRKLNTAAALEKMSLNAWVAKQLLMAVEKSKNRRRTTARPKKVKKTTHSLSQRKKTKTPVRQP